LKVRCMQEAKTRGIETMETENHEDNAAMLKINRRLVFVFSDPEVTWVKRLGIGLIGVTLRTTSEVYATATMAAKEVGSGTL